ncbi:hypothetical protein QM012_004956 [Aureobasidium pullulans]|uniref:F-box domain-containing protein n=1 Tax=Aureobasidium pullulans TaxID=5580 RepID=A0ABR0T608_AURPU
MPSLLSLPPEIFNAVVDDISGRDVMSLRLVCRHTNALSTHHFGLKCLTNLSFIWTPYSLQGLLDLSKHPSGRYIKRLNFATSFVYAENLTEDPEEQREARNKTIFEQWDERNELVVQALKNLQRCGVQPDLGVFDVPWNLLDVRDDSKSNVRRFGYGYQKFYGAAKPDAMEGEPGDTVEPRPPFFHAIEFVLKAAQQAELPVKAFYVHREAGTAHEPDDLQVLREQYLIAKPGQLRPDFEITITILFFEAKNEPGFTSKVLIDTKRSRYQFSTLPLGDVNWSTQSRANFDWYGFPLLPPHPPHGQSYEDMDHCFRELSISFCDASIGALSVFLMSQARTLRVLHLEHITMLYLDDESDEVLEFLLMLKDNLSLEYLKLARLSSKDDRSRLIGGHDDTWTSKEEIQEGLQMYIQREENDEHSVDENWNDDDDDEGEWITVHHSENEDEEEEVWPEIPQHGDGSRTEQTGAEDGEGSEA